MASRSLFSTDPAHINAYFILSEASEDIYRKSPADLKKIKQYLDNNRDADILELADEFKVAANKRQWIDVRGFDDWITSDGLRNRLNELGDPDLQQLFLTDFKNAGTTVKDLLNSKPELVDAWEVLHKADVKDLANKIDDIEFVGKHIDEIKGAGGYKAWRDVAIRADNVTTFSGLTFAQKLENIKHVWNTKYPIEDMLGGRSFFEDVMGQYRYTKSSGWLHTGDISFNFKGIDFYKGAEQAGQIFAETAVSMKTTITKDVKAWLGSAPMKKNIEFLKDGLSEAGLESNKKIMLIDKAEIHVYMPKDNITPNLRTEWMTELNKVDPNITFEIKALEDFIN